MGIISFIFSLLFIYQASAQCLTTSGDACVFPFTFGGVTFTSCTTAGGYPMWCSTKVDATGVHVTGNYGDCSADCLTTTTTTTPTTTAPSTTCLTGTTTPDLTSREAFPMIEEMFGLAEEKNLAVSICIRDRHDNVVAHIRGNNALLGSVSLSCEKARSTALFMAPSGMAAAFPGLELSNGIISPIQGAWPIMTSTGTFLGSIGVSGAPTGEEDEEIARAGASVIDSALESC